MIVITVLVIMVIILVMIIAMCVLVLMMIVVIMVMGVVLGIRLAEAVGVIAMLTVIGVSLGRMRLVALVLVTFVLMAVGRRCRSLDDLALHAVSAATAARAAMPVAAAIRAVLVLFLGLAVRAFLGLDQRLTVGDRDLIIIRVNFTEGEEAVAVAAIFDEGGLERGFDPRDLGEVDIAAQLLALGSLEIKFLDAVAANDNDPGLFRVGSIDQHLVGHIGTLGGDGRVGPRARDALSDGATVHLIRG
jgi:hypothetical protein